MKKELKTELQSEPFSSISKAPLIQGYVQMMKDFPLFSQNFTSFIHLIDPNFDSKQILTPEFKNNLDKLHSDFNSHLNGILQIVTNKKPKKIEWMKSISKLHKSMTEIRVQISNHPNFQNKPLLTIINKLIKQNMKPGTLSEVGVKIIQDISGSVISNQKNDTLANLLDSSYKKFITRFNSI
jgi:hypothetical protein